MTKPVFYKKCRGCGNIFLKSFPKQIYCSEECAFWSRVIKKDGCWVWTGSKHKFGYGEFRVNMKFHRAHVFSYVLHKGAIKECNQVNHHCDNPSCCNPDHLYQGTQRKNMEDMVTRRGANGRKLTRGQVSDIRKMLNNRIPKREIARRMHVSATCIYLIEKGKNWAR